MDLENASLSGCDVREKLEELFDKLIHYTKENKIHWWFYEDEYFYESNINNYSYSYSYRFRVYNDDAFFIETDDGDMTEVKILQYGEEDFYNTKVPKEKFDGLILAIQEQCDKNSKKFFEDYFSDLFNTIENHINDPKSEMNNDRRKKN